MELKGKTAVITGGASGIGLGDRQKGLRHAGANLVLVTSRTNRSKRQWPRYATMVRT